MLKSLRAGVLAFVVLCLAPMAAHAACPTPPTYTGLSGKDAATTNQTLQTVTSAGNSQQLSTPLIHGNDGTTTPKAVAVDGSCNLDVNVQASVLPTGAATDATLSTLSGKFPTTLGSKTSANSLSMTFASDQTLPAFAATPTFNLGTLNGAALAANQPTINADAGAQVHVMNFPGTQPVSGTFWQATQPVSGTFWQTTQPSSLADGSDTTLGSKADAATCATTNTLMACFRQLHADLIAATPDTAPGDFAATRVELGTKGDTVCATDTGSCSTNAQIQRLLQRITTLLAVFPTTLDTNTGAPGASTLRTALATGSSVALPAVTTGGATPYHFISTASTNSTLVSTGAHTLYSLTLTGLNATAAYVRLYDTAAAPTCSSATGAIHTYLVIGSATQQGGMITPLPAQGELLANGLAFCITGGSADTDNTSGPAGVLVNASFK